MAPVIEKRVIPQHQQQEIIPASVSSLKDGSVGMTSVGTAQSLLQNTLNHSSHGHGHGHHHSQHQHHHHHNHHHHQHAKENTVSQRGNKKGLEILDFHESWREEMEFYKDSMYAKKHMQPQLLGSHNHAHTPQGCQLDMINNVGANKFTHVTRQHNNGNNNNFEYAAHAKAASTTASTISAATGASSASGMKRHEKTRVRLAAGGDSSAKDDKINGVSYPVSKFHIRID